MTDDDSQQFQRKREDDFLGDGRWNVQERREG